MEGFPKDAFETENMDDELVSYDVCVLCNSEQFNRVENEIVCVNCGYVREITLSDNGWIKSGTELSDSGSMHISGILPDVSGSLKLEGFGNKTVKRMYQWTYLGYFDKKIVEFFQKTYDKITVFEAVKKMRNANIIIPPYKGDQDKIAEHYKSLVISHGLPAVNVNKNLIEKTINIYKILCMRNDGKKNFCYREKTKFGIISNIYYYVNKEHDEIISKKKLAEIFNIDSKDVTTGNNKINKLLKKNKEYRKYINKTPIDIDSFIKKIGKKFPKLTPDEIKLIQTLANNIKNTRLVLTNTTNSVIMGILINCVKRYNFSLTANDIILEFGISLSTINKYEKMFKNILY